MIDLVLRNLIEQSITCSYLDTSMEELDGLHDTIATYIKCPTLGNRRIVRDAQCGEISANISMKDSIRFHEMLCRIEIVMGEYVLAQGVIARLKDLLIGEAKVGDEIAALSTVVKLRKELIEVESGKPAAAEYALNAGKTILKSVNRQVALSTASGSKEDLFDVEDLWIISQNEEEASVRVLDVQKYVSDAMKYAEEGRLKEAVWLVGQALVAGGSAAHGLWALRGELCLLQGKALWRVGEKTHAGALAWVRAANACFLRTLELSRDNKRAIAGLRGGLAFIRAETKAKTQSQNREGKPGKAGGDGKDYANSVDGKRIGWTVEEEALWGMWGCEQKEESVD